MDETVSHTRLLETDFDKERVRLIHHINLQLAALGKPVFCGTYDDEYMDVARDLLRNYQQQKKLLADYRCPVDQRIQDFLTQYFLDQGEDCTFSLPGQTFLLDQPGLAMELSLPPDGHFYESEYVKSYRVLQGVLHNPRNDRRTTKGVFHIVEGGLPIPCGKKAVPVAVFARLLEYTLDPPASLLQLPFTSAQDEQAEAWVSLLLRPVVSPEVPGFSARRTMETRFFAPGSLVSNLDFIERIFGNAGDPYLPENDAALDIDSWTGHTGCVFLAPHLTRLRKKDLGLPNYEEATPQQRLDGMCWKDEGELYNEGEAFKVVCRDMRGVIVTIIADNYFGYSKKEIKSQISYAANLYGGCEEEHSGGALAFSSCNLGDYFQTDARIHRNGQNIEETFTSFSEIMDLQPEGYGIDRQYPDVIYIPEDTRFDLLRQTVYWFKDSELKQIKLRENYVYLYPYGYKVRMEKHPTTSSWRLIGTEAEGTFCHKPCTVSGGGKSEISKSITGAVISGPLYVGDLDADMDRVEEIVNRDYSDRYIEPKVPRLDSRSFLSQDRSLGSVIRLLTPSESEFTPEYNQWLHTIPQHIRALAFIIKRFYRPQWGTEWRRQFSVDIINGYPGHELKYNGRQLVASYLRVGKDTEGAWRIYKVRQDYVGAEKVQMEDDITVSITVPANKLVCAKSDSRNISLKLVENCEYKLFQRPDEARYRGQDRQAEEDLSGPDNFISNFEPLTNADARDLVDDAISFSEFTPHMQQLIRQAAQDNNSRYFVSSAHPRIVDGRPSPNVRYLQVRPDFADPRKKYIAEIGMRLYHRIPLSEPLCFPVDAVLPGRRNNPPNRTQGIRSLAVYNPIHYQELPELFMDYICSLTGKSPSTTGAGSEGALTKGPFNALSPTADLNSALVSYILCGYQGFTSAAGHIGPNLQVDHDISLLIPEIWCRIPAAQRDANYMIRHGYLEKMEDFNHQGEEVLASRLGYRITTGFVHAYLGKLFDNPDVAFDEMILKPELQDRDAYIEGIQNIVEAQRRVAMEYIKDGSIENACPPLKALLHIMASGQYEGKGLAHEDIRKLFTVEYLLQSDWYQERLHIKQQRDTQLLRKQNTYIQEILDHNRYFSEEEKNMLLFKQNIVQSRLDEVSGPGYREILQGTLGADWIHKVIT